MKRASSLPGPLPSQVIVSTARYTLCVFYPILLGIILIKHYGFLGHFANSKHDECSISLVWFYFTGLESNCLSHFMEGQFFIRLSSYRIAKLGASGDLIFNVDVMINFPRISFYTLTN